MGYITVNSPHRVACLWETPVSQTYPLGTGLGDSHAAAWGSGSGLGEHGGNTPWLLRGAIGLLPAQCGLCPLAILGLVGAA